MEIREYNKACKASMLLLPPKYMTGSVFEMLIRQLKDWHIYCVSYDGFENNGRLDYPGAAAQAEKLTRHFQDQMPFDVVYGHGLGARVMCELPDEFARYFVGAGISFQPPRKAEEAMRMLLPGKQYKLLTSMPAPISQRKVQSVLQSNLPYAIWQAFVPNPTSRISLASVEKVCEEELDFASILSKAGTKKEKLHVWYGQYQPIDEQLLASRLPQAHFLSMQDLGRDDILFRAGEFETYINEMLQHEH